jgi:hypothetical protein
MESTSTNAYQDAIDEFVTDLDETVSCCDKPLPCWRGFAL